MKRIGASKRKTKETDIKVQFNIDGTGRYNISTGIPFLDHMLSLFAKHGLFDLEIKAKGDLDVDIHHTNEDVGICLGEAFKKALKDKKGIKRFGGSEVPMDEALSKVILDISGRSSLYLDKKIVEVSKTTEREGYTLRDAEEFLKGFVNNAGINLHIQYLKGDDLHHILEATFKALGKALDVATQIDPRMKKSIPSTKGRL